VKDPVFSGPDVAQAVEAAARALGVDTNSLRYVVLEAGRPSGLGISASPARIAVLLEDRAAAAEPTEQSEIPEVGDRIRRVLGAVIEAAGLDAGMTLVETRDTLRVVLGGPGCSFFLGNDAEVFQALDHLLQRMFAHAVSPRRFLLDCEGYRESRDAALREKALELAAAVLADGRPRLTGPLNAYERRIIHIALQDAAGITTFSVGEGVDRKVTVAPADQARE